MRFLRALGLVLAGALWLHCTPPAPDVPTIEGWTGEPQVAEKIESARAAVAEDPGSADKLGRLGMIFHAHDLHSEAVVCYRGAAELAPEDERWPYLAALSTRTDDLETANALFEEAAARGADHAAFHVNHGDTLAQLGRATDAAERYQRALELDPKVTYALYGLAQLALAAGEPEVARGHLERAAGIAPWHGEVRTLLAQTYRRLGRSEEAERELEAAGAYPETTQAADAIYQQVEAEAVTAVAYTTRARRLAREGRYAEAEELYRKVLAIRSGVAGDYSNLGGTLAGQGKLDEAIGYYRKALDLDDDDPYALNNLAMAVAQKGDAESAIVYLERALEIEPRYPEAHHNMGLIRAGQRRLDEAIEHYRRALEQNPSFARVHNDLGTAWAGLGELDRALESWRRALEIDPRELSALHNLSLALAQSGEHAEAIDWARKGLVIAPNSSRLSAFLAWELATSPQAELRDGARAEALARRVYAAYPNQPAMADVLAAALAEAGKLEAAAALAEKAVGQATAAGQNSLAEQIQTRLDHYRRGVPYRQAR